jgi:hypothetical protein
VGRIAERLDTTAEVVPRPDGGIALRVPLPRACA